ncbi:C-C chemokine receptor type 1-like [Saccostrea echinata]|uniref:C-C chemokine receptor type 1-like n=1 Tax=Saccostrea echinata TaxID=191078 RepID=UPI002A80A0FF|nr:C-C chemokine receptor type 1-like [Saccostrea echinata]
MNLSDLSGINEPGGDLLTMLLKKFTSSRLNETKEPCYLVNDSYNNCRPIVEQTHSPTVGEEIFTYMTPFIFVIGIFGNILSLRVFMTKNMRKLSASLYLASLSTADLMSLIFYVLIEWVKRAISYTPGVLTAPFLEQNGICQILIYLQYISRFLSSWIIVCFTFERYIGVCHTLKRKTFCDMHSTRKIVSSVITLALVLCLYKPCLTASIEVGPNKVKVCTTEPTYKDVSFVLDCIFVMSIIFLPFVIITVLNTMIIRTLYIRNKHHRECKVITEESIIRLEFTIILIAISICFIAFNTPYTAIWSKQHLLAKLLKTTNTDDLLKDDHDGSELTWNINVMFITRTIFYMNYCVNFFLYCLTGAYFRKELRMLFMYKSKSYQNQYHRCSVHNTSSSPTPQSCL